MELSLSRSLPGGQSLSFVSIFVRSQRPFLRPTSPWSTRGQGWPLHQTLRRAPPLSGHSLTASRATARLRGRDNDQRGARYRARFNRATTLYPVGPKTRTMMQSCASAAKLRSGGPILPVGMKAKGLVGVPPPRTVIGAPSLADKAETIGMPSTFSVYCAGRITTPSGTTPSRTSRHRAISSLRAKATIMGFRVSLSVGRDRLALRRTQAVKARGGPFQLRIEAADAEPTSSTGSSR